MPKCVRVDVRQAVALTEFGKPACYAVRVHRLSIFLRKQESLIVIVFTQPQPFRVLPCPVLPASFPLAEKPNDPRLQFSE